MAPPIKDESCVIVEPEVEKLARKQENRIYDFERKMPNMQTATWLMRAFLLFGISLHDRENYTPEFWAENVNPVFRFITEPMFKACLSHLFAAHPRMWKN